MNLRRGRRTRYLDLIGLDSSGRTRVAEAIAGTGNKRSREYKNARRRVERWQSRGVTRIKPSSRRQLEGATRTYGNERHDRFRRIGADMRVQISWYEGNRLEWLPPGRWVRIPAATMRRVIQTWSEEDVNLAAGELYTAFLAEYEVPNIDDWQMETEVVGLELEPATAKR
jgi:hypothetical protein